MIFRDIYQKNDTWVIYTKYEPAGCGFEVGNFTQLPQAQSVNTYTAQKAIPAMGIRVISRKSYFYDKKGETLVSRKGYLTAGDAVVVLEPSGGFSFVRFSEPRSDKSTYGKGTTGWVRSADLVNPFPPASKEPKP